MIKNKIIGNANEDLRNIQVTTWEQIKTYLINNFADRKSHESGIIEIMRNG